MLYFQHGLYSFAIFLIIDVCIAILLMRKNSQVKRETGTKSIKIYFLISIVFLLIPVAFIYSINPPVIPSKNVDITPLMDIEITDKMNNFDSLVNETTLLSLYDEHYYLYSQKSHGPSEKVILVCSSHNSKYIPYVEVSVNISEDSGKDNFLWYLSQYPKWTHWYSMEQVQLGENNGCFVLNARRERYGGQHFQLKDKCVKHMRFYENNMDFSVTTFWNVDEPEPDLQAEINRLAECLKDLETSQ